MANRTASASHIARLATTVLLQTAVPPIKTSEKRPNQSLTGTLLLYDTAEPQYMLCFERNTCCTSDIVVAVSLHRPEELHRDMPTNTAPRKHPHISPPSGGTAANPNSHVFIEAQVHPVVVKVNKHYPLRPPVAACFQEVSGVDAHKERNGGLFGRWCREG